MAGFLVVELAEPQGLLRELTRRLPGTALDLFMVAPRPGGPAVVRSVCQLRGGTSAQQDAFLQALRSLDAGLRTMPAPPGVLRANLGIAPAAMPPDAQAVAAFATGHGLGNVWACIEDGVVFVRLLVPDQAAADLAAELRARLRAAGVEAQVDNETADEGAVAQRLKALVVALEGLGPRPEGF